MRHPRGRRAPGRAFAALAVLAAVGLGGPTPLAAQERADDACRVYLTAEGTPPVAATPTPEEVERLVSGALQATLLEDHETAVQLLERARRLAPADPDVAYHLGRTRVAAGDSSGAIAAYCAYLGLAPNAPDHDHVADAVAELLEAVPAPAVAEAPARRASAETSRFGRFELLAVLGTLLAMILVLLAAGSDGARALAYARGSLIKRRRHALGDLVVDARRGMARAWMEHGLRDRSSTGRRLERLSDAIERLGDREIATLERLEARLAEGASALTRVLGRAERETEPRREGQLLVAGGDSIAIVVLLAVVAAAVVALNTMLIRGAVAQALANSTDFALAGLDASFWVSLGLGLAALAAGLLWYALEDTEPESLHTVLFKAMPFILVIALTGVQVLGYMVVSGRLDIPGRLAIQPNSLFYPVLEFVVVAIGALIPLSLATTGYSLLVGARRVRIAFGERGLRKALSTRPEDTLARIAAHAGRFQEELIGGFRSAAGLGRDEEEESVALIVREEIAALQKASPDVVAVRPTTEVLGPFLLDLGVVVAWALVVGHAFQLFSQPGGGFDPLAWGVAALSACLAVTAAGIVVKRVLLGASGLAGATPALPRGRAGRVLLGIAAASGVLGAALLIALSYGVRPLTPGPLLNLLYAAILTLLLALASAALDDAVVALGTLLRMAGHAAVWLFAELATALSFVAETGLAVLALVASGGAGSRRRSAESVEESGAA
ncbi:MAG TPA: tetratricopeptide repeat protein [Longimicrobiales bacterium]|nr:tetratricopeptide repeat protein [Longimicrobiales bacterium]